MEAIMLNKGYTETNINNNGNQQSNKLKWSGSYNGENGNLDIETNMNGDHQGIHVEFNNDDLAKLFSMPSSNKSLDQQLRDDFDLQSLRQQLNSRNEDSQIGKQMIKQLIKEESFPMIISKYNMDLMTPNRRNKHRYIVMTKKNRKRNQNYKSKTKTNRRIRSKI
jgi:hypothetical protein